MTDPDRLAEIKARRTVIPEPYPETVEGWYEEDVPWLVTEVERLRELLGRLEWAGTVVFDEWYDKGRCCPVCKAEPEDDGHGVDPDGLPCWLAAELHQDG